ncbi:MAG: proprotein convertase P-domain-containing protein, partial [Anaerolineae bacterium]
TTSVAWGDVDGDGDLDLAVGNAGPSADPVQVNQVYENVGGILGEDPVWESTGDKQATYSVAWGDYDGDGDLDLAVGNTFVGVGGHNQVYENTRQGGEALPDNVPSLGITAPYTSSADFYAASVVLDSPSIPITYTLFDPEGDPVGWVEPSYSPDGGGRWLPAVATTDTMTTHLSTGRWLNRAVLTPSQTISDTGVPFLASLLITDSYKIAEVQVWLSITHTNNISLAVALRSPGGTQVPLFTAGDASGQNFSHTRFSDHFTTTLIVSGTAPYTGTYHPAGRLADFNDQTISGTWTLVITNSIGGGNGTLNGWGLRIKTPPVTHVFKWDRAASGFFGQSDNVVFRLVAHSQLSTSALTGTYRYINSTPGPFQRPYASAATFPFRVRGTQVRVYSQTLAPGNEVANGLVYRLPAGQTTGGALMVDTAGQPFRTDGQGYLQGRGEIGLGDQLVALLPITHTDSYTLYYTSGIVTQTGLVGHVVETAGVQDLVVSADNPLLVFNLAVSLEWDAHNDPIYLEQLAFNLQRASEYVYDFSNGQVALGQVNVFQNGDEWVYSHVTVQANNRLRPYAAQGGIVITDTIDPQHNTVSDTIQYSPGQVTMGSNWNRYGRPGQSLGDDWALILAHELGHYLLFHDDTYIGLDENGYLVAVDTCVGSAMSDLYSNPDNTEFVADEATWQANCADTLAEQTLGRNEWETMQLWYEWLITPTAINSGPSIMPFDLTSVSIHDPYTPTDTLVDPTFYIDYRGGGGASSEARAYLDRDDYVINLGSPFGGQNRVFAHGAKPGDRLCVFDRSRAQFGCEKIESGDDRLAMRQDTDWNPIVQISPVNSTTLIINVTNTVPIAFPLRARIFPDLGYGEDPITLTLSGGMYSGVFSLTYPAMNGNIQVWVDEPFSETDPRREAMVAFSIGGNPGAFRGSGGAFRGSGGAFRGSGGAFRGSGGAFRGSGAPIISPDGQMIFFTENPIDFDVGTFFTIQGMAGLPSLPPGRTLVGQGYNLIASPGITLPTGSVSIQYLSNDVLVAGANEADLTLYFWDGSDWTALDTALDTYFNLASALSQDEGVYALMASVKIPLYGPGWNLFAYSVHTTWPVTESLLSIQGYYTTVYGYEPADTSDPWRIYDTSVPTYVNNLEVLEFGKGYWINVSQGITLHLASGVSTRAANNTFPLPPATFYGVVLAGSGFTPTLGMELSAWISGTLCGQAQTQKVGGQVVYAINVQADWANAPGCGALGREVRFEVDLQPMRPTAWWDNGQSNELDLLPTVPTYTLTVNIVGSGLVTPDPLGTVLMPTGWLYEQGTVVTLTATSNLGWYLSEWTGAGCSGAGDCVVTMDAAKVVTATFDLLPVVPTYTLTIAVDGTGSGTVTPTVGAHVYNEGEVATLTATPDADSEFIGWSGALNGTTSPITLAMDGDKAVTATFGLLTYTLSVNTAGDGAGSVSLDPPGGTYDHGTFITLTATPDTGSYFVDWGGDIVSVANPLTLTVESDTAVIATFDLLTYTLTITTTGDMSGSVTLEPVGGVYDYGTVVTLTATPTNGAYFGGWSGDLISADNPATLVMNSDKLVTATFTSEPPVTYTLTVHTVGSGSVEPGGGTYISGTLLSLVAMPDLGWQFDGWSGDVISTTNPISLTMDADKVVTATFSQEQYTLAVNVEPVGSGNVAVDPDQPTYVYGDVVTLTATPAPGWQFDGWSGSISGTTLTTTVTMDAAKAVTATFSAIPTYTLSINTIGQGTVQATPNRLGYDAGEVVTLSAHPAAGYQFSAWSGAVVGTAEQVTLIMTQNAAITATFTQQPQPTTGLQGIKRVNLYSFDAGDTLTYTLLLHNTGSTTVTAVLTDPIPSASYLQYVTGSAAASGGTLIADAVSARWSGDVAPGTPVEIAFAVAVIGQPPAGAVVENVATLSDGIDVISLTVRSIYNPGFGISINAGLVYTNSITTTLTLLWDANLAPPVQMKLSNDGGFSADTGGLGSQTSSWIPAQTTYAGWVLDTVPSLTNVLPRIVYVKFRDADGNVYGPFMDDILYDPTPPQVTTVSISATQQARQRSPMMVTAQIVTIRVAASDDLSGIDTVYVGHTADFGSATTFTAAEAAAG